jgi:signal transduction histidine kinase
LHLKDGTNPSKGPQTPNETPRSAASFPAQTFLLKEGGREIGILEVTTHGTTLSGETRGALEFLAEQLPAVLDLCRLIEQKVALERELAERERMALVGQMASNISHNLKNPLSSMKTILQVQLENPALPKDLRRDCNLIVAEIDRLAGKLGQLLRFSKPALRAGDTNPTVAVRTVAEQVADVIGREAERRSVTLELDVAGADCKVHGSEEALSDVLTNLLVNAIEALGAGGRVRVWFARQNRFLQILIEDDGPGIPVDLQKKIFEPFFTTKSQGTGLGLAIVARRVSEMGGEITWRSPVSNGRGTQFAVTLSIAEAPSHCEQDTALAKEKGAR